MVRARTAARIAAVVLLAVPVLAACAPLRSVAAALRSTDGFAPAASDGRVLCEPGAEAYALRVSPLLPAAIAAVEQVHGWPFRRAVSVYVCATDESCARHTGSKAPAVVTNKLFLSPALFDGARPLDRYLAHELSHLHLVQSVGVRGAFRIPEWFKEGLAEVVSGGATGRTVADAEAFAAVREGRSFVPDEGRNVVSSFLFPRYGAHWELGQPMFYRQCMLFVRFLRDTDAGAFREFLSAVEDGREFGRALCDAYRVPLDELWRRFQKSAPGGGNPEARGPRRTRTACSPSRGPSPAHGRG